MTRPITWTDVRDIAIALADRHPEVDPIRLRFTELHRMVMELDGFQGDAKASNEKILEAIQMAWLDERE